MHWRKNGNKYLPCAYKDKNKELLKSTQNVGIFDEDNNWWWSRWIWKGFDENQIWFRW